MQGPAELMADEVAGYNDLTAPFPMRWENHGKAYVVELGSSTNQAEPFFSRIRRSAHGVDHRMAGTYLDWYVSDLAFREDMRRRPMNVLSTLYLGTALAHRVSQNVAGYWQGVKPPGVLGWQVPDAGGEGRGVPNGAPLPPGPARPRLPHPQERDD